MANNSNPLNGYRFDTREKGIESRGEQLAKLIKGDASTTKKEDAKQDKEIQKLTNDLAAFKKKVYTKTQADDKFLTDDDLTAYAKKSELNAYAKKADVYNKSQVYTKAEVDAIIPTTGSLENYATIVYVDGKVDEINTELGNKAAASDVTALDTRVTNLGTDVANKANESEVTALDARVTALENAPAGDGNVIVNFTETWRDEDLAPNFIKISGTTDYSQTEIAGFLAAGRTVYLDVHDSEHNKAIYMSENGGQVSMLEANNDPDAYLFSFTQSGNDVVFYASKLASNYNFEHEVEALRHADEVTGNALYEFSGTTTSQFATMATQIEVIGTDLASIENNKANVDDVYSKTDADDKFYTNDMANQDWDSAWEELDTNFSAITESFEDVNARIDEISATTGDYVTGIELGNNDKAFYFKAIRGEGLVGPNGYTIGPKICNIEDATDHGWDTPTHPTGHTGLVDAWDAKQYIEGIRGELVEEINSDFDAFYDEYISGMTDTINEVSAATQDMYTKAEVDAMIPSVSGKVDKELTGTNGRALIFNEEDGGGAKFEHSDGTMSFAGVNDGGENGIAGQVYALKRNTENRMEGSRIDVTKNAMYYTVGDAAAADRMVPENEIATKGDIPAIDLDNYYTKAEIDTKIHAVDADIYDIRVKLGTLGIAFNTNFPNEFVTSANALSTMLNYNKATIKVVEDTTVASSQQTTQYADNTVTLNLNGKTLTFTRDNYPGIIIRGGATVTISGATSGSTIDGQGGVAIQAGVSVQSGDPVINFAGSNLVVRNNRSGGELIYCYKGLINIYGGTYRNDGDDKTYMINCYDANYQNGTANIVIYSTSTTNGPKFYDFDPADCSAEGAHTNFVREDCHVVESTVEEGGVTHTVYMVVKNS